MQPGSLPTDEQVEQEGADIAEQYKGKKLASKDDLDMAGLQAMPGEKLVKVAKAEGLDEMIGLPKHALVFEILRPAPTSTG